MKKSSMGIAAALLLSSTQAFALKHSYEAASIARCASVTEAITRDIFVEKKGKLDFRYSKIRDGLKSVTYLQGVADLSNARERDQRYLLNECSAHMRMGGQAWRYSWNS